jgi:hypothetical protein
LIGGEVGVGRCVGVGRGVGVGLTVGVGEGLTEVLGVGEGLPCWRVGDAVTGDLVRVGEGRNLVGVGVGAG